MKDKILEAVQISKTYGEGESAVQALKASDLTIGKGEFASIIGSSGSGKSTLLKILGGLLPPTTGNVLLDGQDLYAMNAEQLAQVRRQKIGFIFQDFNLLDTLTAYENIALALTICKINYGEINKRITNIADKLNMMNIPYCYEVPLYLKGYGYVKPDFKVLNVATRKEYYWEHYGMMDNKDYIIKALKKKNSYISNNFIVGDNLIETYESQSCPLDTRNVEKIIKTFLV